MLSEIILSICFAVLWFYVVVLSWIHFLLNSFCARILTISVNCGVIILCAYCTLNVVRCLAFFVGYLLWWFLCLFVLLLVVSVFLYFITDVYGAVCVWFDIFYLCFCLMGDS